MTLNSQPSTLNRPLSLLPSTTPPPPWSGKKFVCALCTGEFQLEAADRCDPIYGTTNSFLAPACPTPGCAFRNMITCDSVSSSSSSS